mmetsp:Transcript_58517/g.119068  ORF Transcript_58517/g.119068 Transcript_58517/m.119068 type:complete len:88 (+) Transcript_58517:28-291(+)
MESLFYSIFEFTSYEHRVWKTMFPSNNNRFDTIFVDVGQQKRELLESYLLKTRYMKNIEIEIHAIIACLSNWRVRVFPDKELQALCP